MKNRRVAVVSCLVLLAAFAVALVRLDAAENGDVDGSGAIDVTDAIYLLDWIFSEGPSPVTCGDTDSLNGDTNGDGRIDISDAIHLLVGLFAGGPAPEPCKDTGPPHDIEPFDGHGALAITDFEGTCDSCHAMEAPSPLFSAPACTSCHAGGSPLQHTECSSCHGAPPNGEPPVGEEYPNLPGAHATHLALNAIDGRCEVCHSGAGSGSGLLHYYNDTIDLATADSTFDANAGAMVIRSNATCGNVSCHGGIDTPNWETGSISLSTNAACAQCHRNGSSLGNPEDNSPYSGRHSRHRNEGIGCTTCHDMRADANHFAALDTPAIEGPITFSNSDVTFSSSTRRCSGSCHGENHSGDRW